DPLDGAVDEPDGVGQPHRRLAVGVQGGDGLVDVVGVSADGGAGGEQLCHGLAQLLPLDLRTGAGLPGSGGEGGLGAVAGGGHAGPLGGVGQGGAFVVGETYVEPVPAAGLKVAPVEPAPLLTLIAVGVGGVLGHGLDGDARPYPKPYPEALLATRSPAGARA